MFIIEPFRGAKMGQGIEPSFENYGTLGLSIVSATIIEIAPPKLERGT